MSKVVDKERWLTAIPHVRCEVLYDRLGEALLAVHLPCRRTLLRPATKRLVFANSMQEVASSPLVDSPMLVDFPDDGASDEPSATKEVVIDPALYRYEYPKVFGAIGDEVGMDVGRTVLRLLEWSVDRFEPEEFDSLHRLYGGDSFITYLIELQASSDV